MNVKIFPFKYYGEQWKIDSQSPILYVKNAFKVS